MKREMKNKRLKATLIVGFLLFLVMMVSMLYPNVNKIASVDLPQYEQTILGTKLVNGQTMVDENFTTHLPLVLLDTGDQEPRADSIWSEEEGYQKAVDYDPYASGQFTLFESDSGVNKLSDIPKVKTDMKTRLRGNSSVTFPKKQYLLKFYDENGSKNKQDLLNMGKDWEWILNISWHDPSLIRNYLAYTITKNSEVLSPDAKYCEVIRQRGNEYEYLGVYLLMENVEHSKHRVDVPDYRPNQTLSYILRRDRYDENGIILDTLVEGREPVEGSLEVKYPSEDIMTEQDIDLIEDEIKRLEDTLFSENPEVFLKYPELIDETSFIDYFVFNEFFMNYDAGFNSTYMYKDFNGKLKMGPFWDFDQAIANDREYESKLNSTAFHNAPWFKQLLRDPKFTEKIVNRYAELRQGVLSDKSINDAVLNSLYSMGNAAQRDWNRWQYNLTTSNFAEDIIVSFPNEIQKVKKTLKIHGSWLDKNMDSLYQFRDPSIPMISNEKESEAKADFYADLLAVVYIATFLISVILIRRDI